MRRNVDGIVVMRRRARMVKGDEDGALADFEPPILCDASGHYAVNVNGMGWIFARADELEVMS